MVGKLILSDFISIRNCSIVKKCLGDGKNITSHQRHVSRTLMLRTTLRLCGRSTLMKSFAKNNQKRIALNLSVPETGDAEGRVFENC